MFTLTVGDVHIDGIFLFNSIQFHIFFKILVTTTKFILQPVNL